ncbi:MAG: SMC-Scp complex subunit ScpB [Vulcanimicrobiota bacterium]
MADEFIAKKIIEGILFLAGEPLTIKDLSKLTGFKPSLLSFCLKELVLDYETRGIQVKAVAGAFQMCTNPDIASYIEKLRSYTQGVKLSRAALETLAIIAYKQPITRAGLEEIRGVNVDGILAKLMDMKLIRIKGRASLPGKPVLFGTSRDFLKTFGLDTLENLPKPDQILEKNTADHS